MRVTDRVLVDTVRVNLNTNRGSLTRIEKELSSGKRITKPSDDPAGTNIALRYRTDISMNAQFERAATAGKSRLSAADAALGSMTEVVQRARELTVQAGTGTLAPDQMRAVATEINQLIHNAIQIGNTSFAGQFLFAGTKTTTVPFVASGETPAAVPYNGNSNPISIDIGPNATIGVDVPGNVAIQPSINALIQIRDALNAGDQNAATAAGLPALDTAIDGMLQIRGGIGARVNRLESLATRMSDERINLEGLKGQIEDIDVADTIVRLNSARNVYEAALGAAAKAIQPSLADFIR